MINYTSWPIILLNMKVSDHDLIAVASTIYWK